MATPTLMPAPGTIEAEKLKRVVRDADEKTLDSLAKKYGFKDRSSFGRSFRRRFGAVRNHINHTSELSSHDIKNIDEEPPIIINLPEIKIQPFIHLDSRGDAETQILQLSDGHAGKITKTFNDEVYKKRMENLADEMMVVTDLHRKAYDINKLVIIATGDNVQGENPHQGSRLSSASMGARDQVVTLALPAHAKLIMSLRQEFDEIEYHGYLGNHGKVSAEAPDTSNWDLMLYDLLKEKLERYDGVKIMPHIYTECIDIEGFRFLCFHGDEVHAQQGIPIFALSRRISAWFQQFKGFNYAIGGHFHTRYNAEISAAVELFLGASLVSDDDWALKKIGVSSVPSQWTMGIHPTYGITWRYRLIEKEFAPEKYSKE